jgi:hypothetical protein
MLFILSKVLIFDISNQKNKVMKTYIVTAANNSGELENFKVGADNHRHAQKVARVQCRREGIKFIRVVLA